MASDGEQPPSVSRENSLDEDFLDEPEMYWPDDDAFYDDDFENDDLLDDTQAYLPEDMGAWVPAAPPPAAAAAAASVAELKPKTCRARNWMITLFAPYYENAHTVQAQLDHWEKVRAYAFQEERAPDTGRIHLQMYVEFDSVVTNIGIKKAFGERTHCEPRKKSAQECWNYCTKEETRVAGPWTKGEPAGQGKRNDLEAIAKEIEGGATARTVARKFPSDFIRYSRGIEKLILIQGGTSSYLRTVPRQVLLYYGPTRTGKTHQALTLYPGAWMKPLSRQWMDTYEGQSVAIIDEVCPDMFDLQWFLRLVDNYDIIVESKGGHLLWKPDTVIITSNYKPEEWWQWPISTDERGQPATHRGRNVIRHASYEALCARITEVFVFHARDRVQQLNDDEKKAFFQIGA